jgi:hypothetical protein
MELGEAAEGMQGAWRARGRLLEPAQELGFAHFQPGTNVPCPIHSRSLRMGGKPQNINRLSLNSVFGQILRESLTSNRLQLTRRVVHP